MTDPKPPSADHFMAAHDRCIEEDHEFPAPCHDCINYHVDIEIQAAERAAVEANESTLEAENARLLERAKQAEAKVECEEIWAKIVCLAKGYALVGHDNSPQWWPFTDEGKNLFKQIHDRWRDDRERAERLRDALKPFAGAAHVWDDYGGSLSIVCAGNGTSSVEISVARFREALAASEPETGPIDVRPE